LCCREFTPSRRPRVHPWAVDAKYRCWAAQESLASGAQSLTAMCPASWMKNSTSGRQASRSRRRSGSIRARCLLSRPHLQRSEQNCAFRRSVVLQRPSFDATIASAFNSPTGRPGRMSLATITCQPELDLLCPALRGSPFGQPPFPQNGQCFIDSVSALVALK
jgi:hypothetical protein